MEQFDPRRLRISIEIDGKFNIYEGLAVKVSGEKKANALQNSCKIDVFNLKRETRNYLLTETSPFNKNRTRKKVIIEAGRESTGLTQVFIGDIVSATPTQPPDIGLSFEIKTGDFIKGNLVARSGDAREDLSSLSQKAADDAGLTLDFQASEKSIANYSFTGGALKQVDKLCEMGNVNAFVDDDTLIIKDAGKPRSNRIRIVRKDTGMIGIPQITEHGVKVKFLFDNETVIGGMLRIKSELNPAVDGDYEIYKLNFSLASHDTDWYYEAEAKRL